MITFLLPLDRMVAADEDTVYRAAVEADWVSQEERRGRSIGDPESIQDAVRRGRELGESLMESFPDNSELWAAHDAFDAVANDVLRFLDASARNSDDAEIADTALDAAYLRVRRAVREMVLANPRLRGKPLLFLKRNRFACQMLHEYLGYYYEPLNRGGGDLCVLEEPGRNGKNRSLIGDRLPPGAYQTLSLSYDGSTAYFAYVESRIDPTRPPIGWRRLGDERFHETTLAQLENESQKFQIYAADIGIGGDGMPYGVNLRQLTSGPFDQFDPTPLPDGGIAFLSTARGGFVRCNNPWEPLPVYTLHRMSVDGSDVRTLSYHETNEWHPTVLADGRIVYCRWDYMDRSAAHYHGIWTSRPDGTAPSVLFGNYTQQVSACYQPRSIPDSRKILFVAGAHHADTGGSLALLDPSKVRYDTVTAEDEMDAIECVTPEIPFPETPDQQIDTYCHSPWPLSEDEYLTAFSREPLGCFLAGSDDVGRTGLYYLDRFGNLELLYEDPEISCQYPIPLEPRPTPPTLASLYDVATESEDTAEDNGGIPSGFAELTLADVQRSLVPLVPDRSIRELRVFQILPKWPYWTANEPRLGYANAESARLLLGSVPVEPDGSAFFQVPAGKMIYFQAVDAAGRAMQTMRSVMYLHPGERRSCVGCHEPPQETLADGTGSLLAVQRGPSIIEPGPDGSAPWSFMRLVQPVLDAKCIECHHGGGGKTASPDLTAALPADENDTGFTDSYVHLRPFVRWYEWGDESISQTTTLPNHGGADESPLLRILVDENHVESVRMTDEEQRRLQLWLDGNAAFYGLQDDEGRRLQRRGEPSEIPKLQ